MQQHLHKITICHDELGYEIDVPISVMPEFLWRLSTWSEHAPQVGQVEGGSLTAIVAIPVNVQHLLTLAGEQA